MKTPKLGQHFLTRPEIAEWVVDAVVDITDTVLEIGPGHGVLTQVLLERGHTVVAIEKDPVLVRELSNTFSNEIVHGKLILLEEDVRNFDPSSCTYFERGYSLVANIPYYITGLILRMFLTCASQPHAMALLMQKEVAERIVAKNEKQSILSLSVKVFGTPHIYKTVKAGAFSPPPKVDSAILSVTDITREHFSNTQEEQRFFEIIKTAFSQKRKMLTSSLKDVVSADALRVCDIPKGARPEDVRLTQWLCIAKQKNN